MPVPILRRSFGPLTVTTTEPASQFRVAIRDLPTHRTVTVDSAYVADVLRGHPLREALGPGDAGAASFDVELYADGSNVYASGTMTGHVVVACGRCVGPASIPIEEEALRVTFMPKADVPEEDDAEVADKSEDEGVELASDDLDVFPFEGEHVDLERLIREQLVLAVPYAPLCKEDCQGLCPQCGIDRNVETCECTKPIDPRFEALKGLKLPT